MSNKLYPYKSPAIFYEALKSLKEEIGYHEIDSCSNCKYGFLTWGFAALSCIRFDDAHFYTEQTNICNEWSIKEIDN